MILFATSESLWTILASPAHWIAEIIVTVIFDGVIAGLFYPMIRNCWRTWKISRELGARAAYTAHLMDTSIGYTKLSTPPPGVCDDCGGERKVLDTSVDLCTGCGDVQVPK